MTEIRERRLVMGPIKWAVGEWNQFVPDTRIEIPDPDAPTMMAFAIMDAAERLTTVFMIGRRDLGKIVTTLVAEMEPDDRRVLLTALSAEAGAVQVAREMPKGEPRFMPPEHGRTRL